MMNPKVMINVSVPDEWADVPMVATIQVILISISKLSRVVVKRDPLLKIGIYPPPKEYGTVKKDASGPNKLL